VPSRKLETDITTTNADGDIVDVDFTCNICLVHPSVYPVAIAYSFRA
jgi:hypothetical protein